MRKSIALIINILMLCVEAFAQDGSVRVSSDSVSVSIYFPKGSSELYAGYRGNGSSLRNLVGKLKELGNDSSRTITRIVISAGASPEGSDSINVRLSAQRLAAVRERIVNLFPAGEVSVSYESIGADWRGLARTMAQADIPGKRKVMQMLRNDVASDEYEERLRMLMDIDGGEAWRTMQSELFPELRRSTVSIVFEKTEPRLPLLPQPVLLIKPETYKPTPIHLSPLPGRRSPIIGCLGTNLLYDALLIPTVCADVRIAPQWVIGVSWMYGWKERHATRPVYAYGGDIHALRLLGASGGRPFAGHYVGVYTQMLRYNFYHNSTGYVADRWSWGAGIEYVYMLPISKKLRASFGIGIGYLTGVYRKYKRMEQCDVWQQSAHRRWFGPTKAEISLMWVVGRTDSTKYSRL